MTDPDESQEPYICDFCGREVDEAEVYLEDAIYCPECWMNDQEDRLKNA